MKITKYVHSCLLIEEDGKKFLIDPGLYSVEEKAISIDTFANLDYLIITHEHLDHMYIPLIKELIAKFPNLKVFSNSSVAAILKKEGIIVQTQGDRLVQLEEVPHGEIFMSPPPKNVMVTIAGKLTHPGDSHQFTTSSPILALPVQSSWGSTTQAVKLAEKLKPKIVLPIHDWHWSEKGRNWAYKNLAEHFQKVGIKFIPLETGKNVEV